MGKEYQNKLTSFFSVLQQDLKDQKIDQEQFNFLLGIFIKNEINTMLASEMEALIPESKKNQKLTFLAYKKNSTFHYAF